MIQFYHNPQSPFCRRVRIVLEEKNIPYEEKVIDILGGAQKDKGFLGLNPFGKVPVLVDEGLTLFESGAILEYLEEAYPQPALLPVERSARALARVWERVHDNNLFPGISILFRQYYFTKAGLRDEMLIAATFKKIQQDLQIIDKFLEGRKFFVGGSFSLVDAVYAHTVLNAIPLFNIDLTSYKNLQQWMQNVEKRPSVVKTNPGPFRIPQANKKAS